MAATGRSHGSSPRCDIASDRGFTRPAHRGGPLRSLGRAGLGLAGLAIGLVLIELGLTLWYGADVGPWEPVPEARSAFVFRLRGERDVSGPGVDIILPDGISTRPAEGTWRILSYGDSIAAGFGIHPDKSYTALLETHLRTADTPGVELLNMLHGHSPSIYAQHLRHDTDRLSPQAVLVEIEGVNDLADEAHVRNGAMAADGLPSRVVRGRYLVSLDGHLLAPLAWRGTFVERTKLFALLSHGYGRMLERARPNPLFASDSEETYYARRFDRHRLTGEAIEGAFTRLFDSLEAMHAFLAARGIAFAVVVVPSRHAFEAGALRAHGRRLVDRSVHELDLRNIPHLSLMEAISIAGGESAYLDFCHPTESGHAAIADAIADAAREGLLGEGLKVR